ncbi:hypothetical protein SAMN05421743_11150 [Thalassobacillus cyri]|uniref:Uncharacterized protein n=1 Tax=Thalassobacillus cyri TaxID=571932 RepID=A0A1H4FDM6_9BACI|nr:hypothetical protein SAMN05421743_11150 [Thalassobacillus cyri]
MESKDYPLTSLGYLSIITHIQIKMLSKYVEGNEYAADHL